MAQKRKSAPATDRSAGEPLTAKVGRILKLSASLESDLDLANEVERGLPASVIDALQADAQLDSREIHELVLNRRTLTRRRADRMLARDESDRVVRLARTIALARLTFPGAESYAEQWLREPKRTLEGRAPLALLITESGARVVEEMLLQIQEGIFG